MVVGFLLNWYFYISPNLKHAYYFIYIRNIFGINLKVEMVQSIEFYSSEMISNSLINLGII